MTFCPLRSNFLMEELPWNMLLRSYFLAAFCARFTMMEM